VTTVDANVRGIALGGPFADELARTDRFTDDERAEHEGAGINQKRYSHE
jgi:hypothetical protein